jgi:hypothetical protein
LPFIPCCFSNPVFSSSFHHLSCFCYYFICHKRAPDTSWPCTRNPDRFGDYKSMGYALILSRVWANGSQCTLSWPSCERVQCLCGVSKLPGVRLMGSCAWRPEKSSESGK